jgi:DNA-directed RNA polymerase subunit K/omega
MNFKNTNAARTTITRDVKHLEAQTGNIYESIVVISKRANQISSELKEELSLKLQEFATTQDNLEEVFENREQIEISKFYERLPKPHAIAVQEMLEDKIYFRRLEEASKDDEI